MIGAVRKIRTARRLARALPAAVLALAAGCAGLPQAAPPPGPRRPLEERARAPHRPARPAGQQRGPLRQRARRRRAPDGQPTPRNHAPSASLAGARHATRSRCASLATGPSSNGWPTRARARATPSSCERLSGRLTVSVTPPAARVTLSGSPLSAGTYEVPAGDVPRAASRLSATSPPRARCEVEADSPATRRDRARARRRSRRASSGSPAARFDPRTGRQTSAASRRLRGDGACDSGTLRVLTEARGRGLRRGPRGRPDGPRGERRVGRPYAPRVRRSRTASTGCGWTCGPPTAGRRRLEATVVLAAAPSPGRSRDSGAASRACSSPPPRTSPPRGQAPSSLRPASHPRARPERPVESAPVMLALRQDFRRASSSTRRGRVSRGRASPALLLAVAALKRALPSPASGRLARGDGRASLQDGSGSDPFTAFTGSASVCRRRLRAARCCCPSARGVALAVARDRRRHLRDDPRSTSGPTCGPASPRGFPTSRSALSAAARTAPFADGAAWRRRSPSLPRRTGRPRGRLVVDSVGGRADSPRCGRPGSCWPSTSAIATEAAAEGTGRPSRTSSRTTLLAR